MQEKMQCAMAFMESYIHQLPQENHKRRQCFLLFLTGIICCVGGIGWSGAYIYNDKVYLAVICSTVVMLGVFSLYTAVKGLRKRDISIFSHLILFICVIISLTDYPLADIPRSSHTYLLVYSIGAMLFLRNESTYLKNYIPLFSLLLYFIFSVSDISFTSEKFHPPVPIMINGVYVNYAVCLLLTFGILVIYRSDYTNEKYIECALTKAILRDELFVCYQPQIDNNGHVRSAEALLRWKHPTRGFIPPDSFIPVAEASGLIIPLGYWVLEQVCRDMRTMNSHHINCKVSVNLSPLQLMDPCFTRNIKSILSKESIAFRDITLEITESTFFYDKKKIAMTMNDLSKKGASWSLDDLGSGYASLNVLNEMPFDEVKIDRVLLKNGVSNAKNIIIIENVIEMAKKTGMRVVIEGVETEEIAKILFNMGNVILQGFHYSRPLPVDEFITFMKKNHQVSVFN
ncbi:EAL domain-containing protein [Pantoea sp. RSPAM1]|uniref:EAL domain-containing protein n=1 Tax=Pantoea sp. RSPAM1 TaxID=2675223 RepID=UPI00315CAEB2